ncbi:MAG: two-component system response regulator [Cytophagaceae bacterium]|jgi:DNA-binding response OmpR family regulator|nr:two-component system response regulator [Cytophagaceae bacterium]
MKILVVEDETDLLEAITQSLGKEKFLVEQAIDFDEALDKLVSYEYDCILLDIGLPNGSGLDLLKKLKKGDRKNSVIIISAKNSLDDKLAGLDLGADDYLVKPFHLAELNARVRSVLRRKEFNGQEVLSLNNLKVDFSGRIAYVNEQELTLNRKEFDILTFFVVNKNRLVNKTSLAEHVWGDQIDEADNFEFIYSQIKNLRKKLKEHHAQIEIQAVYGLGYKLIEI